MKIMVTGSTGQLGQALVALLNSESAYQVHAFSHAQLDITDKQAVVTTMASVQPDWVLHCAAYTNVEAAEDEGNELNWRVNREASGYISHAAATVHARLIYISTDYVFDGTKRGPYEPTDETHPLNEYGAAKLAGEELIFLHSPSAYVIRTSWVFGEKGHNFVNTMLRLAGEMDILRVVDDQVGCPTYAVDLARFMLHLTKCQPKGGVYHFSNAGATTWFGFAKEILKDQGVAIIPVDSTEFVQKATRPKYSVMSTTKAETTGFKIPTWQDALIRFKANLIT